MSTPEQRVIADKFIHEIIATAAGDNKSAKEYLYMVGRITRVWDDIYDQDNPAGITRKQLLEIIEYLFVKLPVNGFFNQHREILLSQHISAYNAWMASNKWLDGDETEQMYAHVWPDTINEILPIVALLTQSYKQMEQVSDHMRKNFKAKLGD